MNDQSQHINHYSAAEIERYLSGNMSASEMHAMEKAALDDPFLAEAIEGMEEAMRTHGSLPVNKGLEELQTAIAEKVRPGTGKVRTMVWWKVAAAAVVVIAAGIFLWDSSFNAQKESTSNQVATVQKQEQEPVPVVENADTSTPPPVVPGTHEGLPSTFNTRDNKKAATAETTASIQEKNAIAQADRARSARQSELLEKSSRQLNAFKERTLQSPEREKQIPLDTAVPVTVMTDGARLNQEKSIDIRSESNRSPFNFSDTVGRPVRTEIVGALQGHIPGLVIQNNAEQKRLNNVIRGRVLDNAQRPIQNANLSAIGQQQGMNATYFTDRDGFFNIPVRTIDTAALNVSVTAVGFSTQQFRLNQSPAVVNNLELQPADRSLNDVTVAGYGKQKSLNKKIKETDLLQQNAEPVTGWVSYENYLRQSNRLSKDSARAVKDVVVSFSVSRRGELTDFTITSGSTTEANAEAIRLIKEGPAWKLKRGRKATATVIVHF